MRPRAVRLLPVLAVILLALSGVSLIVNAQEGENPTPVSLVGGRVDDKPGGVVSRQTMDPDQAQIFLLRLHGQPLASYRGGIEGLEATNPGARGERKLDASSPASIAYRDYLLAKQDEFIARAENLLGREIVIKHQYYAANNGLAIYISPEEASQVRTMPDVIFMQPNFKRELTTDVTPQWIGAPGIWDGSATGGIGGTSGEGIIIGVIDTGINPSNPPSQMWVGTVTITPTRGVAETMWGYATRGIRPMIQLLIATIS